MEYDAVVVGSGPNGLAAAITMQQAGLSVLLVEAKETVGGGLRSAELTVRGFSHDICSSIHPMAAGSPFFKTLPLEDHGLEYIYPTLCAAHPLENGDTGILSSSFEETFRYLKEDGQAYEKLIKPLLSSWPSIVEDILGPIGIPKNPIPYAMFGLNAIQSAHAISKRFKTTKAKALWAGMSAHSLLPFTNISSAAIGIVLSTAGHLYGWPLPKGGSQQIANALASYFTSIGGTIRTNFYVRSLNDLPSSKVVLFDVTPKQLLQIAGYKLSPVYKWQLGRYRYGMGVFKVDWALDGPIPFKSEECRSAGTVHIGNTYEEIAASEKLTWEGKHPERPFVLLAQQSLFDPSRAPKGKHTGWAYCHVPHGSTRDMTDVVEKQVERFAPGFRDRIVGRHVFNTAQFENYNPNYIGGDINGGAIDVTQLFTRPVLRSSPYRTSAHGIYICSASTPPGGGVHGMCGYHAAKRALKDVFRLKVSLKKKTTENILQH